VVAPWTGGYQPSPLPRGNGSGIRELSLYSVRHTVGKQLKVHPHILRHACGSKLANDGVDTRALQAYLGHKNIQHTVRYAELAPTRFKNFWKD
jgi:site-specific recombinase XerD